MLALSMKFYVNNYYAPPPHLAKQLAGKFYRLGLYIG